MLMGDIQPVVHVSNNISTRVSTKKVLKSSKKFLKVYSAPKPSRGHGDQSFG